VRRLSPTFPNAPQAAASRLRELLDDGVQRSSWLRAVALHVASYDSTIDVGAALARAASDPELVVRETAAWVARGGATQVFRVHKARHA
jgi:hypothetical protein